MKKNILCLLLMAFQVAAFAQNHFNIRLQPVEQANPNKLCYNFQLAAADAKDLNLAGQNYRLYYDASILSYHNSRSLLPERKYENFRVRNFTGQESAQGMGYLPFEDKLGLLSVSVDLDDVKQGGIVLDALGDWTNTCSVCFDRITSKIDEDKIGSLIWARPELTASYATAYIEVAEWVEKNVTVPAFADQYEDMAFNTTATSAQQWEELPVLYPNPIKDHLWIKQPAQSITSIEIWTISGQQAYTGEIEIGDSEYQLDLSTLVAGLYQIRLIKDQKQHIQFFEKQ